MKRRISGIILMIYGSALLLTAQSRVGDPGVLIDESKFDADYPQMERWANAGVRGGIPFIDGFDKTAEMNPGNSAAINAAINTLSGRLSSGEKGLLTLKNGTYTINASVKMKSNVSLIGESREGVVCNITMTSSDAFLFSNVKYCGLYNLTIQGSWGTPKYPWNYSLDANREFSNENISVKLKNGTTDCWLEKVTILNSAHDPLRCPANHNTFRDLIVDGCKRKAGGAEGYFFIQGGDNLITGCQITHLRHISLQGDNVEYNVVYDNDFRQEVSFHAGDNGNNLIANNRITLPADMPPIEAGETGPYPETENGKPIYFAIMGPWSTQHTNSHHPNYLFRNKCLQLNHNYGPREPWSDASKVYYGPQQKGLTNQQRIDNFPEYSAGMPDGGVLYAVFLGDPVEATGIEVSDSSMTIKVNEKAELSALVLPDSATNKEVTWASDNAAVVSVEEGKIKGMSEGSANIIVSSDDGDWKDTCFVIVSGLLKIPVEGILLSKTSLMLMPGQSENIMAEVVPEDAYDQSLIWTSSDTAVAYVEEGKIVARAEGNTEIMASTIDGVIKAACIVTVANSITYVETFDNLKLDGWGSETFTGNNGFVWNVDGKGVSAYIDGKGIYFHSGKTGIISNPISSGIGSFSMKCLDKWSDGEQRKIELLINGEVVGSTTHTGTEQYTFETVNINVEGDFTLAIRNASGTDNNNTLVIDDITWTSYSETTALREETMWNIQVYPNPFGQKIRIEMATPRSGLLKLFDISGKLLLSELLNNQTLCDLSPDYSQIPCGIYFIQINTIEMSQVFKVIRK